MTDSFVRPDYTDRYCFLEFVNSDCWFVQFAEGIREAKKGRRGERRWLGARPVYVV
jgi:hypothetical protein